MRGRVRLSESEMLERAADWGAEIFSAAPELKAVIVRYDPRLSDRRGKLNKTSILQTESEQTDAARVGDLERARSAMQKIAHVHDPGFAACEGLESLTTVLAERLRRGEVCFADQPLHDRNLGVTVWRE